MATLAQVRQKVDDWLTAKWPALVSRQTAFFGNHGRYWQGLKTATLVPAFTTNSDGDAVADRLSVFPTDEIGGWSDAFPDWVGVAIPCVLVCDNYDGPLGKGWCATVFVSFNGTTYTRSQNVGPETWRTKAWAIFSDPV